MSFKLGRLPRLFNPKIMHMSALMCSKNIPNPPDSVDWTKGITEWGMHMNDQLGDCTCAGIYNAVEVWSVNVLVEKKEPDSCVLSLYSAACGYVPGDDATDQGGIEQNVLKYIMDNGIPLSDGTRDKIIGFVEVDPRNVNDVKVTINDFGVAYIGFDVPNSIYDENGEPKSVWEYDPNDSKIEGGHCIIAVKYDNEYVTIISWGSIYKMSWEFFTKYTDECYAIVSPDWISATGKDPLGMTVSDLESLMSAIKE